MFRRRLSTVITILALVIISLPIQAQQNGNTASQQETAKLREKATRLANNAPYFAWCDFDRAVNAAAQFDRNEIRMMAQLKLAQGILDGRPRDMLRETAPH